MTEQEKKVTYQIGEMIIQMIHEIRQATNGETAYAKRVISFPQGSVELFIVTDPQVSAIFEIAVAEHMNVQNITVRKPQTEN